MLFNQPSLLYGTIIAYQAEATTAVRHHPTFSILNPYYGMILGPLTHLSHC